MKVAIFGYGKLGKCLEKCIQADNNMQLEAIFSRRKIPHEKYVPASDLAQYIGKIDVVAIATGSKEDITNSDLKYFNTVDSYDVHQRIDSHKQQLNDDNTLSIVSVGWDPGILSIQRALCHSLSNKGVYTFWGKGVSQGHSNALMQIEGVKDAIQFTVPNSKAIQLARQGIASDEPHTRVCYINCDKSKREEITEKVLNMPYYFQGYPVKIYFVSGEKIRTLWQNTSHKGLTVSGGDCWQTEYRIHTDNNALFTAQIMCSYIKAVPRLIDDGYTGVADPLDIPIKYIVDNKSML